MAASHEGTDEFRHGPGCLFWISWVAATVAGTLLPLAWSDVNGSLFDLRSDVNGSLFDLPLRQPALPWSVDGVLALASVGLAQALVLLPYFKLRGSLEWLAATVIGQMLVLLLALVGLDALLAESTFGFSFVLVLLLRSAAVIIAALPQWFVLRGRVTSAWRWVFANVSAVLLFSMLVLPFMVIVTRPTLAQTIVFAMVMGISTGAMMVRLMRNEVILMPPEVESASSVLPLNRVYRVPVPQAVATNRVYRVPVPHTLGDDSGIAQVSEGGVIQMPQVESASSVLSPSEVLLLNGEQASRTGLLQWNQGTNLLQYQLKTWISGVSRGELLLMIAAMRVALLAVERNGEIKLKVKKDGNITIEQGRVPEKWWLWPQGSLEARIAALARMSRGDTVIGLMSRISVDWKLWRALVDNRNAELHIVRGTVDALVERGIAELIPGDGELLGVIPYRRARAQLTEAGEIEVSDYDLEEVRQLLLQCKQKRPHILRRLDEEIVSGLIAINVSAD